MTNKKTNQMTRDSLPHLKQKIETDYQKLQSSDNLSEFILNLITIALQIFMTVDFYRFRITHFSKRDGYRKKHWHLSIGCIELNIPKLRKSYYIPFFEKILNKYSEDYLDDTLLKLYLGGLSIREIERVLPKLKLKPLKKSQISKRIEKLTSKILEEFQLKKIDDYYPILFVDAVYEDIRQEHHNRKMAVLVVYGLSLDGKHKVLLHLYPTLSETAENYGKVFRRLKEIGLANPLLIISDSHPALKKAIRKNFPGVSWQRCAVHLKRDIFRALPGKRQSKTKTEFIADVRDVLFSTETKEEARQKAQELIQHYEGIYPDAVQIFKEGYEDSLCFFDFPRLNPVILRTTNPIERFNREIRKRSKDSVLYPDKSAYLRQIISYLEDFGKNSTETEKECFSQEAMLLTLKENQELLKSLPESVRKQIEKLQESYHHPERNFALQVAPSNEEATALIRFTDEEDLSKKEAGVLQIARESYFCKLEDQKKVLETEFTVLIDREGYAEPLQLRLSMESFETLSSDSVVSLIEEMQEPPLILCTDTLSKTERQQYQSFVPEVLIQEDISSIIENTIGLIPKGDKENQRKSLKRAFSKSLDLKRLEKALEPLMKALGDEHPDAYHYLSSQLDGLCSCFQLNPDEKPMRNFMSPILAEQIFPVVKELLKESDSKTPEFSELLGVLIKAADQLSLKWQVTKRRRQVRPERLFPEDLII